MHIRHIFFLLRGKYEATQLSYIRNCFFVLRGKYEAINRSWTTPISLPATPPHAVLICTIFPTALTLLSLKRDNHIMSTFLDAGLFCIELIRIDISQHYGVSYMPAAASWRRAIAIGMCFHIRWNRCGRNLLSTY